MMRKAAIRKNKTDDGQAEQLDRSVGCCPISGMLSKNRIITYVNEMYIFVILM